ncbi:MAG: putative sulfate exporter family transporter [Actinomycetota bacterium]|nr:putative sulfate exporter family transporter [Actinomycetota bacterium]
MSVRVASSTRLPRLHLARVGPAARRILPGLLLAAAVGLAAHLVAKLAFPFALAVGFEIPLAMLLGLILVNVGSANEWAAPGIRFAVKYVLGLGIVLLGLRLNLQSVALIGSEAFGLVFLTIGASCTFALLVGRRMGIPPRVALLIGVGTSVCGASAIVAVAPVLKANDREVSFSVATITVFGTLAVFVYPIIGHALGLDVLTFGLWSGTAVPDTAQTIASGAVYSTIARDVATVVKLVRNVLIIPLLLIIAWGWNRYGSDTSVSAEATKRSVRKAFPIFLIGFLVLALVRTARLVDPETLADVDVITRGCFVVALAAFGLQTRLRHIRTVGARPFLLGFGTFGLLGAGSLALILIFGLGPARTEVHGGVDPRPLGVWTPVCERGSATAFAGAFLDLSRELENRMGKPIACAEVDESTGDTVQHTTRGQARLSNKTGRATFSEGRRTWSIVGSRLLVWSGSAVEPPAGSRSVPLHEAANAQPATQLRSVRLTGRVMATGIPGAGALSPVGTFHPGGPMHDNRAFAATTEPGEVLDPTRLLVASTSNFGATSARADWSTGSILSLSTKAPTPLKLPADFAQSGTQATTLDGEVQMYTAQAPSFLNRLPNSEADTADMPAVSNPLGISVNNAFGRPWFANAPMSGSAGIGMESVLDPDGRPLSEALSERAGGVFAGSLTNSDPQRVEGGLQAGAIGNAFLGASPDTSGRAVFAVATADGALVQVHVEEGVDGLVPPGTLAPVERPGPRTGPPSRAPSRVGMVFNWVPDRFLYVTDPNNDAILQLHLDDDFEVFHVTETRRLDSAYFATPVDLAPAVPEIANPAFSSNTTLAGGADLYVANRDSGTIVRMRQDGQIVAVAQIELPGVGVVGADQLNGIAVSPDARKLWVSLSGSHVTSHPELSGSVIQIPAFGAPE